MEKKTKIALISSFTADLLPQLISKNLEDFEIYPDWYIAPFNHLDIEVMESSSGTKQFNPQIIFLLFYSNNTDLSLVSRYAKMFPNTNIMVSNAYLLAPQTLGLYKQNNPDSIYYGVNKTNLKLIELAQKLKNVFILDFSQFASFYEPKYDYLAKVPFGKEGLKQIALLLAKATMAIIGKRKKCLVLDLDNVMWGGTLAEDGAERLKISSDGEGKAFYDFQKIILELYNSGIILAICSKNDEAKALDAIKILPEMVLREDKFAAIRINWLDKARNIKSIAEELNIGLDSLVFLDDSSFERSAVKKLLPQVAVPEMPDDFSQYSSFLAKLPYFDTFSLTDEDSKRGELYVQERKRQELKTDAISFEDFLRSLHMTVKIKKADRMTIPRIAQLTQKTNQFNLSLNRYQETDVARMSKEKNTTVYCISSSDDLGDAGIVGAAIIRQGDKEALLDTFLMSCRVLGRGIEDALFYRVMETAKKAGAKILTARYNANTKNVMVREFLMRVGFVENVEVFTFNLDRKFKPPVWIKYE